MAIRNSLAQLAERLSRTSQPRSAPSVRWAHEAASILPSRFRIEGELGRGGMGVVLRVFDAELGHEVALKSLGRLDGELLLHLKNEFRVLAQIRHPNLVDLYELFVLENTAFFTMELVAGTNLVEFTRPSLDGTTRCDFERLRDAARQLALGLSAVHAAGKLHRDVKPSNVRVTPDGRVALLDFGLVDALMANDRTSAADALVGTVEYMSPEQARGQSLSAASDWYSYGATIFEACAGRLPLERPVLWLVGTRSATGPPPLSTVEPAVPADIEDLVRRLLSLEPESRPTAAEILRVTSGVREAEEPWSIRAPRPKLPFENRTEELAQLSGALETAREGRTVLVRVHGPSGIGKTELVSRFVEGAESAGAVVLRGRCHQREQVAFNALDGVVDELSRYLVRRQPSELGELLSPQAGALPRLFPVMGRVVDAEIFGVDPAEGGQETRLSAARALKTLLTRIAERTPLVLWLDDLQWGDEDSGWLLRELVAGPDPPNALVVLGYRTEDQDKSRALATLDQLGPAERTTRVEMALAPLSEAQTLSLVERLLEGLGGALHDRLSDLARESEGLPFFAHELALYLTSTVTGSEPAIAAPRLSDMVIHRLGQLPENARAILEIVCVAGGPLEHRLVGLAAGATSGARLSLSSLEQASLIRTTALEGERRAEIYHHRIREVVLSAMNDDSRRAHHRAIAGAMLTLATPNLGQVVEHYEASGDVVSVRRYVVAAAKQAVELLAFDRAARLYGMAIEVGATELRPFELQARLAEALAQAGRGRESGDAFDRAARMLLGAAETERAVFLKRRSAQQYLQSGQWELAGAALDQVVERLDIQMPTGPLDAARRVLGNRLRSEARLLFPAKVAAPSSSDVDRAELLRALTEVYSFSNFVRGMTFCSQLLADALRIGQPDLVMVGLALESAAWAYVPGPLGRAQSERLLERFTDLLPLGGAYERGGHHMCRGTLAWYRGDFRQALQHLDQALPEFRAAGRDAPFQVAVAHCLRYPALAHLGELDTLARELEPGLADADSRGDAFFLSVAALGHQAVSWLAADRPERALYWRDRVLSIIPAGFTVPGQMCLVTTVLVHLYRGEGLLALAELEKAWPELRRYFFLSMRYFGEDLRQLRARATLAAAVEQRSRGEPFAQHLRSVKRLAARIERHDEPYARAHADLLRADVAVLQGEERRAVPLLARALDGFGRTGLRLYAEITRLALGRVLGAAGASDVDRATAWLTAHGVVSLPALARTMTPGCFAD